MSQKLIRIRNEHKKFVGIYKLLCLLTFCFLQNNSFAQESIIYDDFPRDWQLYQRDSLNTAIVPVVGKIAAVNYENVSIYVNREDNANTPIFYKKQAIKYDNFGLSSFDFRPKITAGLINYEISLYVFRGKDSTLLVKRKKLVCGDVILFYGQSNALAFADINNYHNENEFCRTIYIDDYAQKLSFLFYQQWGSEEHIGSFACEYARLIKEKYKIPVCVINGAVGSTTIIQLSDRDSTNPQNPNTYYGRFLIQTQLAKLSSEAKMMVFRQGESEALEATGYLSEHYHEDFEKLYSYLQKDFKSLQKIYLFQNNIYYDANKNAGLLRDYQWRSSRIFDKIVPIATVGTVGFDGLHYLTAGYAQSGLELSRIVGRDFYNDATIKNIDSPMIQKCILANTKKTITLVFDANQTIIPPKDTIIGKIQLWRLKDYVFLDGKTNHIDTITASENKIIIALKDTVSVKSVTYLPAFFPDFNTYRGVTIKNQLGMRALTFENFGVAHELKFNYIKTILNFGFASARLEWQVDTDEKTIITIEKAKNDELLFTKVASLQNGESSFEDKNLESGTTYKYRLKATSQSSESAYSEVYEIKTPEVVESLDKFNGVEDFKIYPNPVTDKSMVIKVNSSCNALIISDLQGNILKKIENIQQNSLQIGTDNLPSGIYLVTIFTKENHKLTKKIIIP